MEERYGTHQDRLRGLDGTPPLRGLFIAELILARRVQDGNAKLAVFVNVWVEGNRGLEGERRRQVWVGWREAHAGSKVSSCDGMVSLGTLDGRMLKHVPP